MWVNWQHCHFAICLTSSKVKTLQPRAEYRAPHFVKLHLSESLQKERGEVLSCPLKFTKSFLTLPIMSAYFLNLSTYKKTLFSIDAQVITRRKLLHTWECLQLPPWRSSLCRPGERPPSSQAAGSSVARWMVVQTPAEKEHDMPMLGRLGRS